VANFRQRFALDPREVFFSAVRHLEELGCLEHVNGSVLLTD
jgi:hypothetical protein